MKTLLILILWTMAILSINQTFGQSEFSLITKELQELSNKKVNVSFKKASRGISGFYHNDTSFGNCKLNKNKVTVIINKTWWYDISKADKAYSIWNECKKTIAK
jgi:hypothetical protein